LSRSGPDAGPDVNHAGRLPGRLPVVSCDYVDMR
jgi:hypothetical protein